MVDPVDRQLLRYPLHIALRERARAALRRFRGYVRRVVLRAGHGDDRRGVRVALAQIRFLPGDHSLLFCEILLRRDRVSQPELRAVSNALDPAFVPGDAHFVGRYALRLVACADEIPVVGLEAGGAYRPAPGIFKAFAVGQQGQPRVDVVAGPFGGLVCFSALVRRARRYQKLNAAIIEHVRKIDFVELAVVVVILFL